MPARKNQLTKVVSRVALAAAFVVAVAFPLGYFAMAYGSLAAALATKAEIKAEIVSQLIAKTPGLWTYQQIRLEELLIRHPLQVEHEMAVIRDGKNDVVVRVGSSDPPPGMRRARELFDSGRVVGRIEIEHSLRDEIAGTVVAAVLGMLLGVLVFVTLRVLPLRALQRVTDALYAEKERAEVTLQSIGDAVITTDAQERIEYLNPVAEQLTGWRSDEVKGRPLSEVFRLVNELTGEPIANPLHQALAEKRIVPMADHTALIRRDERTVAIEDSAAPILDHEGNVTGGVVVFHDVSTARVLSQRMTWQATHDTLTGLVNRREFENRVEAGLASARNSGTCHAVCYMDLDQFKIANDTSGHGAGDELLKQLATLLQTKVRQSDTLARLGGDEFGVLLDGCPLERAQLIAADLLAAVGDFRLQWQDKVYTIGVSIGLAAVTPESGSLAEILSAADSACYAAKEQGRNRVYVHRSGDEDMALRRREMNWVARINRALEEHRLTLYYQSYLPLSAGSDARHHIEILLRMIGEDGKLIQPGSFLPAAERYNLMPAIDRWVIRTVFTQYQALVSRFGGRPLMCAINLSGASLNDAEFLGFVREQARAHDLPPDAVCFEITETAAINNLRKVGEFMKEIQALGFRFALDDFGSGTSSFGYLKNLPVDYLKIDGGFVKDIGHDPVDKAMTEMINRVGHLMGIKTVAEFAETDAVIGDLRSMGVDYAQGYAVSVPIPLSEATDERRPMRSTAPATAVEAAGIKTP